MYTANIQLHFETALCYCQHEAVDLLLCEETETNTSNLHVQFIRDTIPSIQIEAIKTFVVSEVILKPQITYFSEFLLLM
jgi:hypothetical protein